MVELIGVNGVLRLHPLAFLVVLPHPGDELWFRVQAWVSGQPRPAEPLLYLLVEQGSANSTQRTNFFSQPSGREVSKPIGGT